VATRVAGRYQLIRELGAGKMGRVFQAVDVETGQAVAAKIMIESSDLGLQGLLRFQQEGALLSTLKHPNIVQVYSTHLEEHLSCIIMELLEGRTLRTVLHSEVLTLRRIKDIAQQVADALAYAHRRGIVHRDIKPDNIMIVGNDRVKVTDFGIARIIQDAVPLGTLTASGMSMGTPLYMSPEQIESGNIDGRTDIYAFGCVLYEMVAGHPPFEGQDPLTVAFKHVHKAPSPPAIANPDVPDDWEALILKCLAKHPDHRYQTSVTLVEAIQSLEVSDRPAPRRSGSPETLESTRESGEHTRLEIESQTLLHEARTRELSGDLKSALQHYRAALTLAPPGPTRTTIEAAVARITESVQRAPRIPPAETETQQPRSTVKQPEIDLVPPAAPDTQHEVEIPPLPAPTPTQSLAIDLSPAPTQSSATAPTSERPLMPAAPPAETQSAPSPAPSRDARPPETTSIPVEPAGKPQPQNAVSARVTAVQPPVQITRETISPARRPRSRTVLWSGGALASVLVLVGAGIVFAAGQGNSPPSPTPVPTAVAVAPLSPVGVSTGGEFRSGQKVTLDWKKVPAASLYQVQISEVTTPRGSVSAIVKTLGTLKTRKAAVVYRVVGARVYSWRVRAEVHGRWSAFSRAQRFSVAKPSIAVPVPLTPRNGTSTTNRSVHLCWSSVKGAKDYVLAVTGHRAPAHLTRTCTWMSLSPGAYSWSVAAEVTGVHLYRGSFSTPARLTIRQKPRPTATPMPPTPVPVSGATSSGTTGSSTTSGTTGTSGSTGSTGSYGTTGSTGSSGSTGSTGSSGSTGTSGTSGSSSSTGSSTGSGSTGSTSSGSSGSSSSSSGSSGSSSGTCDPQFQVC
jgi:serine/threonine protein kinase